MIDYESQNWSTPAWRLGECYLELGEYKVVRVSNHEQTSKDFLQFSPNI